MSISSTEQPALIAEDRRRRIVERVLQQGSVSVNELAEMLGVGGNTIRRDLDALDREGRLRRSYGGAVPADSARLRPPYDQTRGEFMREKSWIGEAALSYLPETGTVFIGSGSTTYQLASRLTSSCRIHAITNSLEVAVCLASGGTTSVDFPGGSIRRDGLESDLSMSREALDGLYWDVTMIGAEAIDPAHGITALDRTGADLQRFLVEHGRRSVILCDSSKLGRYAYAKVGPVGMIDTLITDAGVAPEMIGALAWEGVEVVVAGPGECERRVYPAADTDSEQ